MAEHYMELLAFVERVAKARLGDSHEAIVHAARRLLDSETTAEVHLANECPECGGAGWYDDSPNPEPERCGVCRGTGNALRRIAS